MGATIWILVACACTAAAVALASPDLPTSPAAGHAFSAAPGAIAMPHQEEELIDERKKSSCPALQKPNIPTKVPSWSKGSRGKLKRKYQAVGKGKSKGAYLNRRTNEVVIKKCTPETLAAVIYRTRLRSKNRNPTWYIYFGCPKSKKHVIKVQKTMHFGNGSSGTKGSWYLIAPSRNVVLDGKNKGRILSQAKLSKVVVYGITFQNGAMVNENPNYRSKGGSGGMNGGAVLVGAQATFVADRCQFLRNKALSYYARLGGGGAIKCETKSEMYIYNSLFRHNIASVGGALATSSAHFLHVVGSKFFENTASGGVDGADRKSFKSRKKANLLIRGGAVRIDSVADHPSFEEHVVFCDSTFKSNRIVFSRAILNSKFRSYRNVNLNIVMRASGAALTAWNTGGRFKSKQPHFFSLLGVKFERNAEYVDHGGRRFGRYVLEVEGAGDVEVKDVQFSRNKTSRAIVKIDNSTRFGGKKPYKTDLKNIKFKGTKRSTTKFDFQPNGEQSKCSVANVTGMRSGNGDCKKLRK